MACILLPRWINRGDVYKRQILDGAAQTANTNKMKFDIAKEVGNGKVIEITYHITDVFGMTKDLTFYVQTLN